MITMSASWLAKVTCSLTSDRADSLAGSSKPPLLRLPKTPRPNTALAATRTSPPMRTAPACWATRRPQVCIMRTTLMTTEAKDLVSAPTRRERQRAATYDEIVTVARQLLGSPDSLSLRAIAAEMGLTAPALYRYVDSYHELLMLVARAIFEDVISAMSIARDRYGDDDPAAQIVAATAAFRGWALTHPAEFGLIFANPAIAEAVEVLEPTDVSSQGGGAQFSDFFTDI